MKNYQKRLEIKEGSNDLTTASCHLNQSIKPINMNRSFYEHNLIKSYWLFCAFMLIGFSQDLWAGSGGDAFSDVWDTLKEWTQGTLGRIIAGAMVLVGIVGGIARQSLMAFALGIGGGMGLYNTPTVVESVLSASLPEDFELNPLMATTLMSYLN